VSEVCNVAVLCSDRARPSRNRLTFTELFHRFPKCCSGRRNNLRSFRPTSPGSPSISTRCRTGRGQSFWRRQNRRNAKECWTNSSE